MRCVSKIHIRQKKVSPGGQTRGYSKNVQRQGFTFSYISSLPVSSCQAFLSVFQIFTLKTNEHLNRNVSLQTMIVLAGGQI
jgi:hypothetical protein